MIDPFFEYIKRNRTSNSNVLYGEEFGEKRYLRAVYKALPKTGPITTSLGDAILLRQSTRVFQEASMSIDILSQILEHSLGWSTDVVGVEHRAFPSAGGLYPVEVYVVARSVKNLDVGIYHYAAREHALAMIDPVPQPEIDTKLSNLTAMMQNGSQPSAFIAMTFMKGRSFKKYGTLSYLHAAFESGHMTQNMCLVAASLGVGICPLGGAMYEEMNEFLNIDGMNENYLYALALGLPK